MVETIRKEVLEYHVAHAVGDRPADAFAAWWLSRRFNLSPVDAVTRAPGGSHGSGLDGFYLEGGDKPILHLFQSRFGGSKADILKGFEGLCKTMGAIASLFHPNGDYSPPQSAVLRRLGLFISQQSHLIPKLTFHFRILHLCDEDSTSLGEYLAPALQCFADCAAKYLPGHACRAVFDSPAAEVSQGVRSEAPAERHRIRFRGQDLNAGAATTYYTGIGYLSDLVHLYALAGESLFAKNVRFHMRRNEQSGPAKYMRQTLAAICVDQKLPPEQFAILHNGVTLHACSATTSQRGLELRGPSVLNGCQTIVNAARFFEDKLRSDEIDVKRWNLVPVPLRVVTTACEGLVRRIAVSNNRQVAVRSSAFRAHDPQQLSLAERFAERRIYYERQEGAFDNLRAANPRRFCEAYSNSYDRPLRMEDLAQAIAIASDRWALSTVAKSDLFEDPIYGQIFSDQHAANLHLLVFLVNLRLVVPLVLKDLRGKSAAFADLPIGRFRFVATRLLAKYIAKYEPQLISNSFYSIELLGRAGTDHPFRVRLRQLASAQNSGLQQALPKYWLASGQWQNPTDPAPVAKVLKDLDLDDYSVFEQFEQYVAAAG